MIEQFRQRYPLASLTSKLLKIYHGKYLVRTSVKVDGAILSTGMGEGETIEQAEDSARTRAISALSLDSKVIPTPVQTKTPPKPDSTFSTEPTAVQVPVSSPPPVVAATPSMPEAIKPQIPKPLEPLPIAASSTTSTSSPSPEIERPVAETLPLALDTTAATTPVQETPPSPVVETAPVVPIASAVTAAPSPVPVSVATNSNLQQSVNTPIDFSEIIAQSDVELKRLGWDSEQGRNYLLETYGKRSRQLLSDEELIEFLQYLQHLPSPVAS